MSNHSTRNKLITIIKQHQMAHGLSKLPIAKLSDLAGISRQAFNRYYGDLKDYSLGKQSIARLLTDDNASLSDILENKEERILQLERDLAASKLAHELEMTTAIDKHISSLMNNDIMAFEAEQISSTLINQGNHNSHLNKRLTELKVQNAKLVADAVTAPDTSVTNGTIKSPKNFIAFELDLKAAKKAYAISKDMSAYENAKDAAIQKTIQTVKNLPKPENIDVLLFQEKYISDFGLFCKKVFPSENRTLVVIQLPIYSREEIQILIKNLKPAYSISIYVPYSSSEAIISAQRQFYIRDIPLEELKYADEAKPPLISWGFDGLQSIKIKQGD